MSRTTIKIDTKLNRHLAIIAILENRKKEEFINSLLYSALQPLEKKYKKHIFS